MSFELLALWKSNFAEVGFPMPQTAESLGVNFPTSDFSRLPDHEPYQTSQAIDLWLITPNASGLSPSVS